MPFTVSHVAVVWPLRKLRVLQRIPWSSFAIGAMAPDAFYFVGLAHLGWLTHSVTGLWLVNLPLAVLLTLLWLLIVRPAVVDLSPWWLRQRWQASTEALQARPGAPHHPLSWRGLAAISVGALFGAFSHLLIDAFTHGGRWGAWLFPVLEDYMGPLSWYSWLQYATSILGLLVLAALLVNWYRTTKPQPSPPRLTGYRRRVLQIAPFILAVLTPSMVFMLLDGGVGRFYTPDGWNGFAPIVLMMGGFGCFTLLSSLIWRWLLRVREAESVSEHAG